MAKKTDPFRPYRTIVIEEGSLAVEGEDSPWTAEHLLYLRGVARKAVTLQEGTACTVTVQLGLPVDNAAKYMAAAICSLHREAVSFLLPLHTLRADVSAALGSGMEEWMQEVDLGALEPGSLLWWNRNPIFLVCYTEDGDANRTAAKINWLRSQKMTARLVIIYGDKQQAADVKERLQA